MIIHLRTDTLPKRGASRGDTLELLQTMKRKPAILST